MLRSNQVFMSLAALGLVLGACSSAAVSSSSSAFCSSYCARVTECDKSQDADTCTSQCSNATSLSFTKFRSDLVTGAQKCVEAKDCKGMTESQLVTSCMGESAALLTPTSEGTALCNDWEGASKKCTDSKFEKKSCLENAKSFSDVVLADARKCLQKDCKVMPSCIAAKMDISGGAVALPAPVATPCDLANDIIRFCQRSAGQPETATSTGECTDASERAAQCVLQNQRVICRAVTGTLPPAGAEGADPEMDAYTDCVSRAGQ